MAKASFVNGRVEVITGDITKVSCDAIVNAANASLYGGGGVDGAIHRAGGPEILEQCRKVRKEKYPEGLPDGEAVLTGAGNLPAKYVIHTVGPVWRGGASGEEKKLGNCYRNSLQIGLEHKIKSIAFPAISTGVFGYPMDKAAKVSSQCVKEFLLENEMPQKVIFVFFSQSDAELFLSHCVFTS